MMSGALWAMTLYRANKPMETFTISEEQMKVPQVKFN